MTAMTALKAPGESWRPLLPALGEGPLLPFVESKHNPLGQLWIALGRR
jgi:hypothetical protein